MIISKHWTNLLIVIICILAITIPGQAHGKFCDVGFLRVPCQEETFGGPSGAYTFGELVTMILNILLLAIGSIAVLFFIIGGFRYVTAHGNEQQAEGAKDTMKHAVFGLIAVIMSFAIIYIITSILTFGSL